VGGVHHPQLVEHVEDGGLEDAVTALLEAGFGFLDARVFALVKVNAEEAPGLSGPSREDLRDQEPRSERGRTALQGARARMRGYYDAGLLFSPCAAGAKGGRHLGGCSWGGQAKACPTYLAGGLGDLSTMSLGSVETAWSRHSQRIISGRMGPPIFCPWRFIPHA